MTKEVLALENLEALLQEKIPDAAFVLDYLFTSKTTDAVLVFRRENERSARVYLVPRSHVRAAFGDARNIGKLLDAHPSAALVFYLFGKSRYCLACSDEDLTVTRFVEGNNEAN